MYYYIKNCIIREKKEIRERKRIRSDPDHKDRRLSMSGKLGQLYIMSYQYLTNLILQSVKVLVLNLNVFFIYYRLFVCLCVCVFGAACVLEPLYLNFKNIVYIIRNTLFISI